MLTLRGQSERVEALQQKNRTAAVEIAKPPRPCPCSSVLSFLQ
jgi:hypothetical protein